MIALEFAVLSKNGKLALKHSPRTVPSVCFFRSRCLCLNPPHIPTPLSPQSELEWMISEAATKPAPGAYEQQSSFGVGGDGR